MLPATAIFFVFLVVLFAAIVGCQLLGFRLARQRRANGASAFGKGTTAVTGSLFALLGLLVAFTISGGEARLDARRKLIVEEANTISTAYLRLDLLPATAQRGLREDFRRYVDARLAYYANFLDFGRARIERRNANELQGKLWTDAVHATNAAPDSRAALLVLPAINQMLDVTTAREAALRTHVPLGVFALLMALALACAFFAGADMAKTDHPSTLHAVVFAATLALTCYVIVNIELPRLGFSRLGAIDALLVQARQQMN
ncbi:MAG TPA: DUF4239 domain-containing protein [Polyangia bacterium]|nr:DUF4239 domain-containing protein [Polyangia bacterium]